MSQRIRVGLLFGGRSGEHEVSLVSARSVMQALDPSRYDVVPLGIDKDGTWVLHSSALRELEAAAQRRQTALAVGQAAFDRESDEATESIALVAPSLGALIPADLPALDVIFPVLHGPFGEDGTVQGLFELAGIPYVGAGVAASATGMDKVLMKALFRDAGLPTVPMETVYRWQTESDLPGVCDRLEASLGYPCFTKPANLGSSVGISKAHNRGELESGLRLAAEHDRKIVVEAGLAVREVECGVLGNDHPIASVVGEIIPSAEFYDYDAKYRSDATRLVIPAEIPEATADEIRALAISAFRAIDGSGLARVDFFLEKNSGRVYVNEINTMPGFTAVSMYPKLWEATGIAYPELVDRLIALALERHAGRGGDPRDTR